MYVNHLCWFLHVQMNEAPVYGKRDLSFTDYMAPGMITRYCSNYYRCKYLLSIVSPQYGVGWKSYV